MHVISEQLNEDCWCLHSNYELAQMPDTSIEGPDDPVEEGRSGPKLNLIQCRELFREVCEKFSSLLGKCKPKGVGLAPM
jgi:hypothetical protein